MGVYRGTNADGSWDNIETEHACLADLFDELTETGAVLCSILRTVRGDSPRERIVTGRVGAIITSRSFEMIQDATIRFVEQPGETHDE